MSTFNPDVICCGHAAYDLNFMMDGFPVEDEKYRIDKLIQTGGGPAANAAVLLARWGAKSAYAGLVGDDIYGRLILEELSESGVDTSLMQLDPAKKTPLSAVIVNTSRGTRTLLNRRNASDQPVVTPGAVSALKHMNPRVIHFDGHALELSLKMIELFPEAEIVVDAGNLREGTDRLCAAADYAICSKRFALDFAGLDNLDNSENRQRYIELMSAKYPGRVVVTLGAGGLIYGERTAAGISARSMKAFEVEAVDSTGAGDIFHAAFSFGLLRGFELELNLRFASAAAALSVKKAGGRTSIPGLEVTMKLAGV